MNFSLQRYLTQDYSWQKFTIIFLTAFIIRALTFGFYIQHEERFRQADSNDYHFCAVNIRAGHGMHRIDTKQPIFWRTPGYPFFLSLFYSWYKIPTSEFSKVHEPIKACLWLQIFLCSWIPLLIFFLTRALTQSLILSWLSAWVAVFHLGFVLASCYLLSDALAQLFFISYLYFFYRSFTLWFERKASPKFKAMLINSALAALNLGIYTWIRPNGQFVVALSMFTMILGQCSWKIKVSKMLLFCLLFFSIIGPWYVRNHNLTGRWFYCPMSGPVLEAFCAPKIVRRISGKKLEDCMRYLMSFVIAQTNKEADRLSKEFPPKLACKELVCFDVAKPWLIKYPWYFLQDWTREVLKTTFDLYCIQLAHMARGTHTYDPLEEFLWEKTRWCYCEQPMPFIMRFICWVELLFALLLWIGLISGLWIFLIKPLFYKEHRTDRIIYLQALWLKLGILIGGMLVMTGGFGYARLRIPMDPLMIILSFTCWYYWLGSYIPSTGQPHKNSGKRNEKALRSMAKLVH